MSMTRDPKFQKKIDAAVKIICRRAAKSAMTPAAIAAAIGHKTNTYEYKCAVEEAGLTRTGAGRGTLYHL
jgi:hypothetical protein